MVDEAPAAEEAKPEVGGIQADDFGNWRRHPATAMFMKYLLDVRDDLKLDVMERWEAGTLDLSTEHEIKGRVQALAEAAEVSFVAIWTFYEQLKQLNQQESDPNAPVSTEQP